MLRHVGFYLPGVEQNVIFLQALQKHLSENPSFINEIPSIKFDRIFKIDIDVQGFLVNAELVFIKIEGRGYSFLPNFQTISAKPSFCTERGIFLVLEQELRRHFLNEK